MNNGLVVYVGPYSFPNGGAAARRIYANALSLRDAGFDVVITSGQMQTQAPDNNIYEGISVISLNERQFEQLPRLIKHFFYFSMGKKTIDWLDTLTTKPKAIILYSGYSPYLIKLLRWSKKNNVKLIFDAVEWYAPQSRVGGFFSPYHLNILLAMRWLSVRTKNIIAISTYLEKHYKKNHCKTILIPPTLDHARVKARFEKSSDSGLILVYAGSPEKKDLLDNVIDATMRLHEDGIDITLHIAGVTKEYFRNLNTIKKYNATDISSIIINHGYIEHDKALDLVRMADFSVLIRPLQRSSHAGFSTKFVESMAVGTPVIANITSDLGNYLIDGVNGFVCEDNHVTSITKQFHRAAKLNNIIYKRMRFAARELSENSFDYRNFSTHLDKFINC